MDAIVAVYSDWGIGLGGTQPIVLKADRAQFRRVTEGKTVIVGRKTLADFPGGKPLKNRLNIVITRKDIEIEGAVVAHNVQEAMSLCTGTDSVVIGGASVYRDFFPYLDRVFVTKIGLCPDSDSYFPNLDADGAWKLTDPGCEQFEDGVSYRFAVYERQLV